MRAASAGSEPALRFPVYEALYLINIHTQKLVDLLEDIGKRFGIDSGSRKYYQSMVQMVRALASQGITEYMSGVEITEQWLFEQLWMKEQKSFAISTMLISKFGAWSLSAPNKDFRRGYDSWMNLGPQTILSRVQTHGPLRRSLIEKAKTSNQASTRCSAGYLLRGY
jgi:hypothetical protein